MTKRKPESEKLKPGAPSKYKPEFCALLVEKMSEGYSIEACAGFMGVSFDSVYHWFKIHPEFSEAKKEGEAASRKYWERVGLRGMHGKIKGFNCAAWIFNMKNRFGWRDQPAMDARTDIPEPTLAYAPRPKAKANEESNS